MLDYLSAVKAAHGLKAREDVMLWLDCPEHFGSLAELHKYLKGIGRQWNNSDSGFGLTLADRQRVCQKVNVRPT